MVCHHCSLVLRNQGKYKGIIFGYQLLCEFFVLDDLIDKLSPETKLIQSAMELFPTSTRENTKKRRKWGPIRSETDVGYENLPKLVPKEENKIR